MGRYSVPGHSVSLLSPATELQPTRRGGDESRSPSAAVGSSSFPSSPRSAATSEASARSLRGREGHFFPGVFPEMPRWGATASTIPLVAAIRPTPFRTARSCGFLARNRIRERGLHRFLHHDDSAPDARSGVARRLGLEVVGAGVDHHRMSQDTVVAGVVQVPLIRFQG
jgi:hypothetical protein